MHITYGVNAVIENLRAGNLNITKIIIAKGKKGGEIETIISLAEKGGIPLEIRDYAYIERLTGQVSHQGVICLSPEYAYTGIDNIIAACNQKANGLGGIILILDGILDPQNLGSVIRTGFCMGIQGIVIPENRSVSVTPAVIKVSAGAAHHMPIAKVVNIANTIDFLKEQGFWIYGADAAGEHPVAALSYGGNAVLVMGNEAKGIRPLVKKKCDFLISIPMKGGFDSLNVAVATAIILYEMTRKREYEA